MIIANKGHHEERIMILIASDRDHMEKHEKKKGPWPYIFKRIKNELA